MTTDLNRNLSHLTKDLILMDDIRYPSDMHAISGDFVVKWNHIVI